MTWKKVLIHHSAGADGVALDFAGIRRQHVEVNGWSDVGYHAVTEKVGEAYVTITGRALNQPGAHCPGRNRDSLGVCLVGNFELAPPPAAQLAEAARGVAGFCAAFDIPLSEIHRHGDFRATACPGKHFDLAAFRRLVGEVLG